LEGDWVELLETCFEGWLGGVLGKRDVLRVVWLLLGLIVLEEGLLSWGLAILDS
jgi:hypothetical protein